VENYNEQNRSVEKQIVKLREEQARDIEAATARLALLERSLWEKVVDWFRRLANSGRALISRRGIPHHETVAILS